MKTMLGKLLGGDRSPQPEPVQLAKISLPLTPLTMDDFSMHRERSFVGWLANRMGQILRMESCESGILIYSSLSMEEINNSDKANEENYLLYLASILFQWLENGQDIYIHIKDLQLSDRHHKCLLQVYEEIKDNITSYFPKNQASCSDPTVDEAVWEVYKDVLYAASQKKFLLIKQHEIDAYKIGEIICDSPVRERSDIPKTRDIAKQSLVDAGIPPTMIMSYTLLISEATTNILKHAKDGRLIIIKRDDMITVLVEDTGTGFPLKILPYTTMLAGYSTKKSLGQGFTLMMKMTEQVILYTSPTGSTIILLFKSKEGDGIAG
jgi:anti-sigma regulatory factor (Ser/Thr protein kinase)